MKLSFGWLKKIPKKATATALGVIVVAFGHRWGLSTDEVKSIATAISVYVGAQGIADHGKEAEKVKTEASQ